MQVFEIIIPGTWLDYEDRKWSRDIQSQLRFLESQFYEANVALNLFNEARAVQLSFMNRDLMEQDSHRRYKIQQAIEHERGSGNTFSEQDSMRLEAEARFNREQWAAGRLPRRFEQALPFIYARAFLHSIDAFEKFLGVLAKESNVPPVILELHVELLKKFPDLRGVRNTVQHMEDRARGLGAGKNPKPIDLKTH